MARARAVGIDYDDKAYLRYLPPHLQERYAEGVNDPELIHLSKGVALMDVRIKSLLETLEQHVLTKEQIADDLLLNFGHLKERDAKELAGFILGYLPAGFIDHKTFKSLERLVDRLEKAQAAGKTKDAEAAQKLLFTKIREGVRDGEVWDDIQKAMEERRKLAEAEKRRQTADQQTMTLDQVIMLAGILIEALKVTVQKYVSDREIQQYILREAESVYRRQLGVGAHRQSDQFDLD